MQALGLSTSDGSMASLEKHAKPANCLEQTDSDAPGSLFPTVFLVV